MASKIIVDQLEKSGYTALTLPSANATANQYIKNDGAGALSWATLPSSGKILHIEQVVKTDTTSTTATSGSPVDITGMTVTMPASVATSRYLVSWSLSIGNTGTWWTHLTLVRRVSGVDVTPVVGDTAGSRDTVTTDANPAHGDAAPASSFTYLDSPATTSAVTYKIKWALMQAGTVYLNRSHGDADAVAQARDTSTLTVMEIGV
jgi:hypothetical protein